MTIREFQKSDFENVVFLLNEVFPNSVGHNEANSSINRKVATQDGLFFVATEAGEIVGTVMAGYDGHRGWLYSLAVRSDQRRHGIGTQLVRHAEAVLAKRGCLKLNLQVRAENAEVLAFYESLGYQNEPRISMGKLLS